MLGWAPGEFAVPLTATVLTLEDVHTYYGKSHMLHGVSLEVGPGEVVGLLGRNGAGKSTLFNCLTGVLRPTDGRILFDGEEITVSAQLGHANPSTTLRHYAKWIPSQGRRWVEVLDRADWSVGLEIGTRIWNQTGPNLKIVAQAIENVVSRPGLEPGTP